jgi:hypothetical protein
MGEGGREGKLDFSSSFEDLNKVSMVDALLEIRCHT